MEYINIKFDFFDYIDNVPCDIFIRLSSGKTLKLFSANEAKDVDRIKAYQEKGLKEFYIQKDDFYKHSKTFFNEDVIEKALEITPTVIADQYLAVIQEMTSDIGIDETTLKTAVRLEEEILKQSSSEKVVKGLFDRFAKQQGNFLYSHSYLTAVMCLQFAKKMDWGTKEIQKKLYMAAIFHDLGYQNPRSVFYENSDLDGLEKLPEKVRVDILNHVPVIIERLKKMKNIPEDVINIIKYHHGGLGEQSYPLKMHATELALLPCVFILCHEFVKNLFKVSFRKDKIPEALSKTINKYNSGKFKSLTSPFIDVVTEMGDL